MLRRRCRLILVVDAGQDFACDFRRSRRLALRKAAIDQQVHVQVFRANVGICARGKAEPGATRSSRSATIAYLSRGGTEGRLLYLKPCSPR